MELEIYCFCVTIFSFVFTYQAEAGGVAAQPVEAAGLTPEIIAQLQDKATVLTQERKRRGKTMPEGLATAEAVKAYKTLASHPVRQ